MSNLSSRFAVFFSLSVLTVALGCSGSHMANNSQPSQKSAPTITFAAQPATVTSGGSAVLSWTTANATSVNIQGLGSFPATGTVSVKPSATTTYTAVASGPGGTTQSSAIVTVKGSGTPPPPPTAGVPASNHVVLVMEENHMYSDVIGSVPPSMPYLISLASKYGLATQYYADTHPSIGNYFMLTTGQILTNNDSECSPTFVTGDNIVAHLMTAGKTWKSYAESLPSVGYTGCDTGAYLVRHNPFAYFNNVTTSSTEVQNLVPFTQFATDLAKNQLPNFSFIVPNRYDDAHDGTPGQADTWLQQNIAPLLASPAFQTGGDGILMIVFDEAETSDAQHGGGHVVAVVVGPKVKPGYQSTTLYQHESTLKTILEALGDKNTSLGNAAGAPDMKEFFQ